MDENQPKLIHIIYVSKETEDFSNDKILKLLDGARSNNTKLDVTGMLLYSEGSFFQILEGEEEIVDQLFN